MVQNWVQLGPNLKHGFANLNTQGQPELPDWVVSSHNNGPSPFDYYVSKRSIISSAFIVMGPGPVVITRLGPITMNAEEIIDRLFPHIIMGPAL